MPPTNPVYATLAGPITPETIRMIVAGVTGATQRGYTVAHVMLQSHGGAIGDGVMLYNLFRAFPIELHLYNGGMIASIAVTAFLGAKHRHVSRHGRFMIHKVHGSAQAGTTGTKMAELAKGALAEDRRIEAIIRENTNIPKKMWAAHKNHDVFFTPEEAVAYGLATDVREFDVPAGVQVFNI